MLKGFKDFLLRGNVIDLAVAVVVGTAFTSVVTAFTSAFLKPLIQVVTGGGELAGTFRINGVEFDYASFINAVITFLITAAVVYFAVVLPVKTISERRRRGEEVGSAEPTDIELLTEIRDLLRERQSVTTSAAPSAPPSGFGSSATGPGTATGGATTGSATGSGAPDDPDDPGGPGNRIPTQDR